MKNLPSFKEILKNSPSMVQNLMYELRYIPQTPLYHPEGDVLTHTKIVFNRCKEMQNFDMMIAAFFHDIGKVNTTKLNKKGRWAAHGHEFESLKILEKSKTYVESLNANYDAVYSIVKEHMRIKKYYEMRPHKQRKLLENPYFDLIWKFSDFDDMSSVTLQEIHDSIK